MRDGYSIFNVMDSGAVVYADEERGLLVTYNGGYTFNIWTTDGEGGFFNTDCWTTGHEETTRKVADWSTSELRDYAREHIAELMADEDEDEDADEPAYAVGDRVSTPDGDGTVIAVDDDDPRYYVDLDDRDGEYSAEYYYAADLTLL